MRNTIIFFSVLLIIFGLVMLASASSNIGKVRHNDATYYVKHQITNGLLVGLAGFFFGSIFPYRRFRRLALPLLIANIILLVLLFTPFGVSAKGATRWLSLGPLTFQPSELLKITFVMYLAAWLSGPASRRSNFVAGFLPFLVICSVIGALLLLEPATSVFIILLLTGFIMYFASGAKMRYIIGVIAVGALAVSLIIYATPYRRERFLNYLNPQSNIEDGNYQLNQSLNAIKAGGLWGVGYGQSITKIQFLPEPIGDSIFAVIAEELGFAGSAVLIFLFASLVTAMVLVAGRLGNRFGKLIIIGFATLIALQTFIHIGAISGLLPFTGIPLPFLSYGGTALAVFMTIIGITARIAKDNA